MAIVQIPRCDCKCAPLGVGFVSCAKSGVYGKKGFDNYLYDDSGGTLRTAGPNGRKYLRRYYQITYQFEYDENMTEPPHGRFYTQISIGTYHPDTDTYTSDDHREYTGPPPDDDPTPKITSYTSQEYTNAAFLGDSLAKFNALPYPDYPDFSNGVPPIPPQDLGAGYRTDGSNGVDYTHMPRGDAAVRYYNKADEPISEIGLSSFKYKPYLVFDFPWLSGGISVRWRERKANYSATETTTRTDTDDDQYITYHIDADETGDVAHVARQVMLSPERGALFVLGPETEVDGTGLKAGDVVTITGPGDRDSLNFLLNQGGWELGVRAMVQGGGGSKRGARPYFWPAGAGVAVPVYRTETAGGPGFSGAYKFLGGPNPYPEQTPPHSGFDEDTFSPNVGRARTASYDEDSVGAAFPDLESELDNQGRDAASVTPTQIVYKDGLVLTLSDEVTTASIVNAAQTSVNQPFPDDYPPGLGASSFLLLAQRFLAPDGSEIELGRAKWRAGLDARLDGGLPSRYGKDWLVNRAGAVAVEFTRLVIDLDTSTFATSKVARTFEFDLSHDPVWLPQADQIEPVPPTNQVVFLYDPVIVSADEESVTGPAVARVIEV